MRERSSLQFPMAAGVVLIIVFLLLITPFQAHGWGYRYLHGYLGSLCLLATGAWVRLTADERSRKRGCVELAVATAASVLVCLPLRAWQARTYAAPSVKDAALVASAPVDVVIVDTDSLWFGVDLVRNDPFLSNRPKVMRLDTLTPSEIRTLCAHSRVELFAGSDGYLNNLGLQTAGQRASRMTLRTLAITPPCSPPIVVGPRAPVG
jgi:hypothetical protein